MLDLISRIPKKENFIFRFFVFNGNKKIGDEGITKVFIENLKLKNIEMIPYSKILKNTYRAIAECDLMISTRLHASIFACYANVPFFLMEYHQKCTDFLIDIGQSEEQRIFDGGRPVDTVISKIMEILVDDKKTSPVHLKETIEKSKRNFKSLLI